MEGLATPADNGHEQGHLMPQEEGESVITVCTMIGGELHYQQRAFTRYEMKSATIYNEIAHTVSRMLCALSHLRTDANRS